MIEFELTVAGGIGSGLIASYPELAHLRTSHLRLVVSGESVATAVARRLERDGVVGHVNALCVDRVPDGARG